MANRTGAYVSGVSCIVGSNTKQGFTDKNLPSIGYIKPAEYQSIRVRISWYDEEVKKSTDWVALSISGWQYDYTQEDLTETNINDILSSGPSIKTIPVIFEMQSQLVGSSEWITEETSSFMTVVSTDPPIVSGVVFYDTNPDTKSIMGSPYTDLILGKSSVDAIIGSIQCQKGTKLESLWVMYPDINHSGVSTFQYYEEFHGSVSELTNYHISNFIPNIPETPSDECNALIEVTDTRGNVGTYHVHLSTYEYITPYAQTTLKRKDGYYPATDITVSCTYSKFPNSLDQPRNHIKIYCWYKKTSDSSYDPSTRTELTDGQTSTLILDNSYSWNVLVSIQDDWMAEQDPQLWITYEYTVGTGVPILFIDKNKHSVGINCLPQNDNDLEVNGVPIGNSSSIQQITITENVSMASQYGYFQLSENLNYPAPNASLICMTTRTPSIAMTSGTIYSLANWSDGNRPYIQYQHGGTDFQNIPHDFVFTFFVP